MATTVAPQQGQKANLPVPVPGAAAPIAVAGETSSSAIAAREKAAVEARFLVALNRPRNFDESRLRLLTACKRPKFAVAARYSKPVGNDRVHGLSIRFAEEARVLWGNLDVSAYIVFDDEERRIYRVVATDLETNATEGVDVMVEKFIERRVVRDGMEVIGQRQNKQGVTVYRIRATEDDLIVKANAIVSKHRRNVILGLIPADVKDECEEQIIDTIKDRDAKDPEGARKDILDAFWTLGVTPIQVSELLGKPLEQINPAELTLLRSYYTALKEGESTWSDIVEAHTGGKRTATSTHTPPKGTAGLKEAVLPKKPGAPETDAEREKRLAEDRALAEADGRKRP